MDILSIFKHYEVATGREAEVSTPILGSFTVKLTAINDKVSYRTFDSEEQALSYAKSWVGL